MPSKNPRNGTKEDQGLKPVTFPEAEGERRPISDSRRFRPGKRLSGCGNILIRWPGSTLCPEHAAELRHPLPLEKEGDPALRTEIRRPGYRCLRRNRRPFHPGGETSESRLLWSHRYQLENDGDGGKGSPRIGLPERKSATSREMPKKSLGSQEFVRRDGGFWDRNRRTRRKGSERCTTF